MRGRDVCRVHLPVPKGDAKVDTIRWKKLRRADIFTSVDPILAKMSLASFDMLFSVSLSLLLYLPSLAVSYRVLYFGTSSLPVKPACEKRCLVLEINTVPRRPDVSIAIMCRVLQQIQIYSIGTNSVPTQIDNRSNRGRLCRSGATSKRNMETHREQTHVVLAELFRRCRGPGRRSSYFEPNHEQKSGTAEGLRQRTGSKPCQKLKWNGRQKALVLSLCTCSWRLACQENVFKLHCQRPRAHTHSARSRRSVWI